MNEQELLRKLMEQIFRDDDIGEDYAWMFNPDDETECFFLLSNESGEMGVFIIKVTIGKVIAT